jgi:hypothetical protein
MGGIIGLYYGINVYSIAFQINFSVLFMIPKANASMSHFFDALLLSHPSSTQEVGLAAAQSIVVQFHIYQSHVHTEKVPRMIHITSYQYTDSYYVSS